MLVCTAFQLRVQFHEPSLAIRKLIVQIPETITSAALLDDRNQHYADGD